MFRVGRTGSGQKVTYESKHETGDGRLISIAKDRRFSLLTKYDAWRIAYCEKHRNQKLPLSFREGKINPFTLLVSVKLRIQEGRNGSRTKPN